MKLNWNLLYILVAIVPATISVPAPNYDGSANTGLAGRQPTEVSMTADMVKRQPPGRYQDVHFKVQIFETGIIILHLVWDCVARRFTARTMGAGRTENTNHNDQGDGQFQVGVRMGPDGQGLIPPGWPGNPSARPMGFFFGRQPLVIAILASADNDNDLILPSGIWMDPVIENGGLTATSLTTFEVTNAEIIAMRVDEPQYHPNTPDARGSGFNTDADDSENIPPGQ